MIILLEQLLNGRIQHLYISREELWPVYAILSKAEVLHEYF